MDYKGKLYGKVNKSYFPLEATTDDWDVLEEKVKRVEIEKRKYAVKILTGLEAKFKWVNIDAYNDVHSKLEYLEQEIANLEEEIKLKR